MRSILAAAVALAIMPSVATAEECVPAFWEPEVDVELPTGDRYYVIVDGDGSCPSSRLCPNGFWIYEESNGIEGLQRWDERSGDTACGNGDTIIF